MARVFRQLSRQEHTGGEAVGHFRQCFVSRQQGTSQLVADDLAQDICGHSGGSRRSEPMAAISSDIAFWCEALRRSGYARGRSMFPVCLCMSARSVCKEMRTS